MLTLGEYKKLARLLRDAQRQPADLLAPDAADLLVTCQPLLDVDRLTGLLRRGFLLSQAIERWQSRAIWVVSRADAAYPTRLKTRLKEDSPPILYGCGDATILETGGLAIVGSRDVSEELAEYTARVGQLAAGAARTVISGGARGIDQAAMRGALEAGGKVAGVLADSLERAAMHRDHRDALMRRTIGADLAVRSFGRLQRRTRDAAQQADLRAGRRGARGQLGLRKRRDVDGRGGTVGTLPVRPDLCPQQWRRRQGTRSPATKRRRRMAGSDDVSTARRGNEPRDAAPASGRRISNGLNGKGCNTPIAGPRTSMPPLAPILTPHGRLLLAPSEDAPALAAGLSERLESAFDRGAGHGLLQLGAGEVGTPLPPVFSYWRELGARYVTAVCTRADVDEGGAPPVDPGVAADRARAARRRRAADGRRGVPDVNRARGRSGTSWTQRSAPS